MIAELHELQLATNWEIRILIVEHDEKLIRDLEFSFIHERDFKGIFFADSYESAKNMISNNYFDVISSDYLFGRNKNGIQILKDLDTIIGKDHLTKKIIYTQEDESTFSDYESKLCSELEIEVIRKTMDHEFLFNSIKNFYYKSNRLPNKPKYAFMNDKEFINHLSSYLVNDLSSMENQEELMSFTSDSAPITISDLILNIKNLTPLGKEYLGTWFSSLQHSLRIYERQLNKLKNL